MLDIARRVGDTLPLPQDVVSFDDWDAFLASGDPTTPLPEVDPEGAAQIQYTSGTTGTPKGAMIPHRGIVNDPRQAAVRAGGKEGGVWRAITNPVPTMVAAMMAHPSFTSRDLGSRQVRDLEFAFVNGNGNGGIMSEQASLVLGVAV